MGLESLGDAGIGIVAAVLIIREVMSFLARREEALAAVGAGASGDEDCDEAINRLSAIDDKVDNLSAATQSMAAILTRTDPDGLPLCYTPRSLTGSIDNLGKSIERLTDKVERM